jgi:hypothetical protein
MNRWSRMRFRLWRWMDRWHRVRPSVKAAVACGVITVAAVAAYYATSTLHEWWPHIAAAAATIGLTVTVVEVILRRERDITMDAAMRGIEVELGFFGAFVWEEFLDDDEVRPPYDVAGLLRFWLDRKNLDADWAAAIIGNGLYHADGLRILREQNLRVLPAEILAALHDHERRIVAVRHRYAAGVEDQVISDAETLVESTETLVLAANRHLPFEIDCDPFGAGDDGYVDPRSAKRGSNRRGVLGR